MLRFFSVTNCNLEIMQGCVADVQFRRRGNMLAYQARLKNSFIIRIMFPDKNTVILTILTPPPPYVLVKPSHMLHEKLATISYIFECHTSVES